MNSSFHKITHNESFGGIFLLIISVIAFGFANSPLQLFYENLIHYSISIGPISTTLHHFVNDGLMVIFFYYVGLEIKKELIVGELSDPKKSSFAILAALGGMIFPALIYAFFNKDNSITNHGWGIPMATDIAFAVGILALLGKRIPKELKIFLLALAIVDDLGAVIVIALFYTQELSPIYLLLSTLPLASIYFINQKKRIQRSLAIILGLAVWALVLKSGIHATIAGVILAFFTPFHVTLESGEHHKPLEYWLQKLHPYIVILIMPLFAFFNAGVELGNTSLSDIVMHPVAQGVGLGLFIGKPLGIFIVCYLTSQMGVTQKPKSLNWPQIAGVGMLAGIGFTMSLFVSGLSFNNPDLEIYSKSGIMLASMASGFMGYLFLKLVTPFKKH